MKRWQLSDGTSRKSLGRADGGVAGPLQVSASATTSPPASSDPSSAGSAATATTAPPVPQHPKRRGWDFYRETLGSPKYVVAPMVDGSELPWRLLSRRYGAQLAYSPMINAQTSRANPLITDELFTTCAQDRPVIVQFCANDPDTLLAAARYVEHACDAVDLNLGCPQNIAKRGHYGAFLQDDWPLIERLVRTLHDNLSVPVTAKMRILEDADKTVEYARMLERAGAQMIGVHGRRREQKGQHMGLADWAVIKRVVEAVGVPVLANGNVLSKADADRCIAETGAAGVMSADSNLLNPALFSDQRLPVMQLSAEYLDLAERYPVPLRIVRSHLFKIWRVALAEAPELREQLGNSHSIAQFRTIQHELSGVLDAAAAAYRAAPAYDPTDLFGEFWVAQGVPRVVIDAADRRNATLLERRKRLTDRKGDRATKRPRTEEEERAFVAAQRKASAEAIRRKEERDAVRQCQLCHIHVRSKGCEHGACRRCCVTKCRADEVECEKHFGKKKFERKSAARDASRKAAHEEAEATGSTSQGAKVVAAAAEALAAREDCEKGSDATALREGAA